MTSGHARRLLLQRNILYCASQQREEPGGHDQSFDRPGHHCRCPWLRPGRHPGCCRGDQADPDRRSLWYGPGFHGKRTANGERFNTNDLTAAHKTLPFGTKVRVTNERTGHPVVVRINDRGPYAHGRVIDLSKAAAETVGISGLGKVTLAAL